MAKKVDDAVLDAAHAEQALGNQQLVCAGEPADRADALARALAAVSMTPGLGNGDYTALPGDVSGRKIQHTAKSSISITATGTADHIAIIDATRLLRTTTATPQPLTAGGTVSIPSWKAEIEAPV